MRTLAVFGLALTCGIATLPAQRAHQFELGAFGSFTHYDQAFNLDNQAGAGGRLGYFFSNVLSAELDAGYQTPTPKTGSVSPTLSSGSASLVLNFGTRRTLFYVLGGYSRLDYEDTAPYRFTDNAMHGAIGDRIFLGDRAALRLEVRGIYAPSTGFAGADWAGHVVASLGLSFLTQGGSPQDADRDGVPDGSDACPDTPVGARVDARGCPTDSDKDGIYDGLDQCPNTPAGARVNANGCPTDTDGDGVFDGIDQCPGTPAGAQVDAKGAPPTPTVTAWWTVSTVARARPPGRLSTRPAAPSTRTRTACRTAWTNVPTHRQASRWTMSGASDSGTRTATAWTTHGTSARARRPGPALMRPAVRSCSRRNAHRSSCVA